MAAGKTQQSNTSLVALVVFIILFLICAVVATIFYTRFEDQKALTANAQSNASKQAANSKELTGLLKEMVTTIIGELPEAKASAIVNDAKMQINESIKNLGTDATAVFGQDNFDLLNTISDIKDKLDAARQEAASNADKIAELTNELDLNNKQHEAETSRLIADKNQAMEAERSVTDKYNSLKELMEKTNDQQMQNWADKLEAAEEKRKLQDINIATLTEQLADANLQLDEALEKVEAIKSFPDNQIAATKADATVFTADTKNGLIYLNIGSEDHVFPGLTFSIFDRNAPIPKEGKGKAEIEVFRVNNTSCVAKVLSSSKREPVIKNDVAVNMIWDSKTSNSFMVVGDFDFDGDGTPDRKGKEKIGQMIRQWNGRIVNELTINTDFIVVGQEPEEMTKPTIQQIEDDPEIEGKYAKSVATYNDYQDILEKAKTLSIPVFNRKRFMQLTGYEAIAEKSSPKISSNSSN